MVDLLIISGASKGIGKSIAEKCFDICNTMIVIGSSDKINDIKTTNTDCKVIRLKINLIDHKNVYEKIKDLLKVMPDIKSIGIVLCGAQIGEPGGLFDADLNDWDTLYQCNVLGNLSIVKGCESIIKSGVKTRIVFFGGGGAAFSYVDFSGYALSKVATVRAAENLAIELSQYNVSVISVAPGAVATDILDKVIAAGGEIRTRTDISEPTNFVYNFLTDTFPSKELNGKFLHVRDDIKSINFDNKDIFKLRRIQ